jgi:hypothetical protein
MQLQMNKPENFAFSDNATFTLVRGDIWIFLAIVLFAFLLALFITDIALVNLAFPFAVLSIIWFAWVGVLVIIARGHRIFEKRAINRMFAAEIWECWQFQASEWQALVEAESNLISPKEEGLKAYVGAVYSSIFGVIIAAIMIAVGQFVMEDPVGKSVMWIAGAAVFLLLLGIGLFQPVYARYEANRYEHKALRVLEPRVWFGSDGIYHETLGYTSLKELTKVTDQTKSRKAIKFTLTISTDTLSDLVAYSFPVPAGCEQRAGKLVRRYRGKLTQQDFTSPR